MEGGWIGVWMESEWIPSCVLKTVPYCKSKKQKLKQQESEQGM